MQPQIGKMIGASSISRSKSDFKAADLVKMGAHFEWWTPETR